MNTEQKQVTALLRAARELISDPAHWTQSGYAKDEEGQHVSETSPRAVCWCSLGALNKIARRLDHELTNRRAAVRYLLRGAHAVDESSVSVATYNDTHTHAEVMTMFDKAIEEAEADGQ